MIDLPITGIVKTVGDVLDKLFTSDDERAKAKIALLQIQNELPKAQIELNMQEAKHSSIFVSGWRPWLGWGLGTMFMLGCLMDILVRPILSIWGVHMMMIDLGVMVPILTGMLGMSAIRSFDKLKGTDTKEVGLPRPPSGLPDIPPPSETK